MHPVHSVSVFKLTDITLGECDDFLCEFVLFLEYQESHHVAATCPLCRRGGCNRLMVRIIQIQSVSCQVNEQAL